MTYKVKGVVKDNKGFPIPNLSVEAFDKDPIGDNYLGNSTTNSRGEFEIEFEENAFRGPFELFEGKPDIYVTVKDSYGRVLFKSDVRSNGGDLEHFDITIEGIKYDDPYSNSFQRIIASFNSMSDTVTLDPTDLQRIISQMMRALSSWTYYTREEVMHSIGHHGPYVPRYPKKIIHEHKRDEDAHNDDR